MTDVTLGPNGSSEALQRRLEQLSPAQRALFESKLSQAGASPAADVDHIPRRADGAAAPLTAGQEVLWTLQRALPDVFAYNVPRLLDVRGHLDIDALHSALDAIVARHEILRTRFVETSEGPRQVVDPPGSLFLERLDLRGVETRGATVTRLIEERIRLPFNLESDPPLRATVVRVEDEHWRLLLVSHHIASDEASRDILFRELGLLYQAALAGTLEAAVASLPPLPVRFGDFAAWQKTEIERGGLAEQIGYWRGRLLGLGPLELPTDRPRTWAPGFDGARHRLTLPDPVRSGVAGLARRSGASQFMVLLAAVNALLHRYTGQTDIAVGSPVAGRRLPDLEHVMGFFPSQVVLRTEVDPALSFAELLQRVRETCLSALERQDVPVERLQAELTDRADSREPLFRVNVQMSGGAPTPPRLGDARVQVVAADVGTAKFDLVFGFDDDPGGLRVLLEYRTDLFAAATIERMGAHLCTLLAGVVSDPEMPVGTAPLLTATERAQILDQSADVGAPGSLQSLALPALVRAAARRRPHATAVQAGDGTLSYAGLLDRSASIAAALVALGVRPGARVAVCLDRHRDLVATLLGVLRAGAAYVPLDPAYPLERIGYVLEDAGVGAVVVDGSAPALTGVKVPLLRLDAPIPAVADAEFVDVAVDPESLAYVLYTSGSTGRPKGVMIPHRALSNFLGSMAQRPGLAAGDALIAVTTISFDISGLELWLPLITGAEIVLASRETAADGVSLRALVERTAEAHSAGHVLLQATPATWRILIEARWTGTPNLVMLCGGEAWPAGLAEQLLGRGSSLWNVYGPTETTIWSSHALVTSGDLCLGEPLANTGLYVLEPSGALAPHGVPGELWIGGMGVALGYHARPELTAERFVSHPELGRLYRTGDLVRRMADGRLLYLGRLDDQVKVRGYRIELGEIESVLLGVPEVVQAVVSVQRAAGAADPRLVAHVVLTERGVAGEAITLAGLRDRLHRMLPEYMIPTGIMRLDALPLTPNGKVDRRALPMAVGELVPLARPYVAPRSPLEEGIAALWRDVLGVDRVGVDDDFFALGGHSLLAMRVLARLPEVVPVRLTLGALFEARTVAGLAALAIQYQAVAESAARPPRAIPRRDDPSAPAPLSRAQELLWIYEQKTPGTPAYNLPIARRVRGPLDPGALERSLNRLAARHEALRTAFVELDGEPRQLVRLEVSVALEQHDLRGCAEADRESAAAALMGQVARRPFDLTTGAGPRAALVRLADDDALLLLVLHHLVCDGASVGILLAELAETYSAETEGRDPALSPVPLHQADLAAWERAGADAGQVGAALEFWREYLAGAPGGLDLPTDRPRPGDPTAPSERSIRVYPLALRDAVRRLAQAQEATPFMVLLAGFQALLHRCASQNDVVVGVPIAGRTRAETQRVVGHLADTLALRGRFDDDPTFAVLLSRVREACRHAFAHQDIGFDRIARELRHAGAAGGAAADFNIAFVLQDGGGPVAELGRATIEAYPVDAGAAKFELTLSMTETALGLRASLEYRSDLFDRVTADALLSRLERLLDAAVAAPATAVSRLPLLDLMERRTILEEWRGVAVDYPRDALIHALVAEQARLTPAAVAVVLGDRSLTYAELDGRANQLAHRLRALGIGPDRTVGICVTRSLEMMVGLLAILKAGGAYVPLDPTYPAQRLGLILVSAEASVVLTQEDLVRLLPLGEGSSTPRVLRLDADWPSIAAEPATALESGATAETLAYVMYTSGSTGAPKGVAAVHRGVVRLVINPTYVRLGPSETLLSFAPLTFDASTLELWGALCTGGRLVIFPSNASSLEELGEVIARYGVTTLWLTAALFHQFVDGNPDGLRPLRQLLAGGDVLSVPHVLRALDAMPDGTLINGYGPTENTTFTCCHPLRKGITLGASVPIGRPIGNTTVYLLDRWLEPVPVGVPGRLYTGGDGLARGYLGRPDLTAERFIPDPFDPTPGARVYDTGDVARWRPNGIVEFLGRADTQVKIRGFRIEPGEVEVALLAEPGVQEAVVVAREDRSGEKRLVAYVVPRDGSSIVPARLRARLAERLPAFMVPSVIVPIEALPLTESGKVDRRALPEPSAPDQAGGTPPRDDVERVVAQTFGGALGHSQVSVEANFFDLGGHSLLAIRVVAEVLKIFRTKLPLRRFFDDPTVSGVARALVAEEAKPGQAAAIAGLLLRLQSMSPEERERLRREKPRTDQVSR